MLLNTIIVAATVSAMANTENIDVSMLDVSGIEQDQLDVAENLIHTPQVRGAINSNFASLIKNIQREGVSLSNLYASSSVSVDGDSDVLTRDYSQGTHSMTEGGNSIGMGTATTKCHSQCHSNHSSRGWR